MATEIAYLSTSDLALSLHSHQLEHKYQQCLRDTDRIYEEERVRLLRVQMMLLEDENDELRDHIDTNGNEMDKLEDNNEDLQHRLIELEDELQHVQTELKARLRDVEHYRREVDALTAANNDTTKIYSEKLALSRELSTLKPELEHLKSQTSTQSSLLSEKLALQRELSAVQVELETEKRAVVRMKTQSQSQATFQAQAAAEDSTTQEEVSQLKKELARSRKEMQKFEKDNLKKSADWETQRETLETKLDAFRGKLRSTKEELKEAKEEVEKLQAVKMAQSAELTKARLAGPSQSAVGGAINPKKRSVARFDPDMTIGTPGHGGHAAKRQKASINVGDKSTFSITPFLNRTMSILPESPTEVEAVLDVEKNNAEMNKAINAIVEGAETAGKNQKPKGKPTTTEKKSLAPKKAASPAVAASSKAKSTASQPLKESTKSKANAVVKQPSLPKVTEEESEDEVHDQENSEPTRTTAVSASEEEVQKKKPLTKRPTIFDDDDEAFAKPAIKVKSLKSLNNSGLGNSSLLGLSFGKTGKAKKTLAEFSPLKKDRKAVS